MLGPAMFYSAKSLDKDVEIEVASLVFECRLSVEAALQEARGLARTRASVRPSDLEALARLLDQAGEALEALHRTIAADQGRVRSFALPQPSVSDLEEIGAAVMRASLSADEFVRESDLALLLGKKLSVVREAALLLQGRGIVERIGGVSIRPKPFSHADLREIFELREALEPFACEQAALMMSDDDKQALVDAVEQDENLCYRQGQGHAEDPILFRYDSFCCRIIRASGNAPLIEILCDTVHYRLWLHSSFFYPIPGSEAAARAERRRIASALLVGDAALSAAEMKQHLVNTLERTRWIGKPAHGAIWPIEGHQHLPRKRLS